MMCEITGYNVKEKEMSNDLPTVSRDEMEAAYMCQKDVGSITDFCSDYFNRKLSDWAAKCQKVYGRIDGDYGWTDRRLKNVRPISVKLLRGEETHEPLPTTHTALLFNVKPIELERVSDSELEWLEAYSTRCTSVRAVKDILADETKAKDIIRRLKAERK